MKPRVVVVGGCAGDVKAQSFGALAKNSDVPGRARITFGGVGRNLAKNFALLGADVRLISAVGDDEFGRMLLNDLARASVNLDNVGIVRGRNTAMWVGILNARGDLETGIFGGGILDSLTRDFIRERADVIRSAEVVCVDATIPRKAIDAVVEFALGKPMYLNPASVGAARKVADCFDKFAIVITNALEAEVLTGARVNSIEAAKRATRTMIERGAQRAVVTLGAEGIVYADANETRSAQAIRTNIVDTTGAGDAFAATFVMGILQKRSLDDTLARALRAAVLTTASEESVSDRVGEA